MKDPARPDISPRARVRATDEVIDQLGRFITSNQMVAGDILPSEQAVGDMFGVSKRVVREALRALTAQGVVTTAQGKRAVVSGASPVAIEAHFRFVQRMDADSVAELYELREVIEVAASELAARRANADDLARAHKAIDRMVDAKDSVDDYIAGDLAFHAALIDAVHNRFLTAMMAALSGVLHVERELGVRSRIKAGGRPHAVREHQAVLEAVVAGDPEAAKIAMVGHMASGRADLNGYISPKAVRRPRGNRAKTVQHEGAEQRGDKGLKDARGR
jgi:GntR family transcriptional regulator, transcriptional repressor for pyruvate dehydrogenase complex